MGMSAPSASGFAKGRGVFTCGPTAGSLLACWSFPTLGKIGCIQDSADLHKLTMFTSTISYSGAPEPNPMPLRATLADGTRCNAILHDQAQHWNNRQGWLYCTDGRLLLTGGSDPGGDYFDTSKPTWTADAVPQNAVVAPTKVAVRSVTWAYGA